MTFQDKLTIIMQKRNITAQDISKMTDGKITVSKIRGFQNNTLIPSSYQIKLLNHIFGIDLELFLDQKESSLEPVNIQPSKASYSDVKNISKPGKTKKPKEVNILKPPKNKECRWCDIETGTECYRHAEDDTIKFLSGGGVVGGKIPDQFTVWACAECDSRYSTKPDKADISDSYLTQLGKKLEQTEHALSWSIGIIKTWLM